MASTAVPTEVSLVLTCDVEPIGRWPSKYIRISGWMLAAVVMTSIMTAGCSRREAPPSAVSSASRQGGVKPKSAARTRRTARRETGCGAGRPASRPRAKPTVKELRRIDAQARQAAGGLNDEYVKAFQELYAKRFGLPETAPMDTPIQNHPPYGKGVRKSLRTVITSSDPTAIERVFGGQRVTDPSFNDCVAVGWMTADGFDVECTGTLIGKDVVVTAGHCAENGSPTHVFVGNDTHGAGTVIGIKSHVRHKDYLGRPQWLNDIMILILDRPVIASEAKPRPIALSALMMQGTRVTVVGFGLTETGQIGVKHRASIKLVSPACGEDTDQITFGCHGGLESVAVPAVPCGIEDTCSGDSGGPLYVLDGTTHNWCLAGITSRGLPAKSCGNGGLYVRVDQYLKWIQGLPGVKIEGAPQVGGGTPPP
jgi:hypothetical protein